jgi:biopolymer transport protein TolR
MKLTPLQKRAERKNRNKAQLDLNLVSLIDVFTILIFFLLSNSTDVETLPPSKAVQLPESSAEKSPRETLVVVVSGEEILVQGRKVATVSEVLAATGDLIEPLKAELDLQQATRQSVRAKAEGKEDPLSKAVTIMGDKDIPYRLLRRVMFTCARANFTDVAFAVRPKESS